MVSLLAVRSLVRCLSVRDLSSYVSRILCSVIVFYSVLSLFQPSLLSCSLALMILAPLALVGWRFTLCCHLAVCSIDVRTRTFCCHVAGFSVKLSFFLLLLSYRFSYPPLLFGGSVFVIQKLWPLSRYCWLVVRSSESISHCCDQVRRSQTKVRCWAEPGGCAMNEERGKRADKEEKRTEDP